MTITERRAIVDAETAARTLELEGTAILYGADPGDNAGAVASGDFNGDGVSGCRVRIRVR